MRIPHVPLFSIATVNDDILPETTDPDFSFYYVDISSISDFNVSDSLARFTFQEAPSRARRLVKTGDIALSTVRTYLRAIAPITERNSESVFSTGFAIIRPRPSVCDPAFLRYATLSTEFIDTIVSHSNGVSYPAINATDVMRFSIPLPPLETQHLIADYLDRETAEIDAAVADLDRYVELLERRKSVAIDNAVEGSQIPLHCMTRIVDCVHTTPERDENGIAEAVRTSSIRSGKYVPGMGIPISAETVALRNNELAPKSGDLFFTREAPAGEACLVPSSGTFAAGQRVVTIRPDDSMILPEYLLYALYSAQIRARWTTTSTGSTVTNIKMATIGQARIPTPSIDRQYEIVQSLNQEFAEIDDLIEESTRLRDLLLKRRSVLITEVVTGRKQV